MRTVDECYEEVLRRCDELAAKSRKRRSLVIGIAAPVCGILLVAGILGIMPYKKFATSCGFNNAAGEPAGGGEIVLNNDDGAAPATGIGSDAAPTVDNAAGGLIEAVNGGDPAHEPGDAIGNFGGDADGLPKYANKLNIGAVELPKEPMDHHLPMIPPLYEMSRDEVLEYFGLSTELDLAAVVDGLRETAPRNGILNGGGRHGFCRGYVIEENGDEHWEELTQMFENDEFVFESEDGAKSAAVYFACGERVTYLRSGMMCNIGDGRVSSEVFYELPKSEIAGVEMIIASRNIGGYYAEFTVSRASEEPLSVGLDTRGLSEEETVRILEYLAEYVGAENSDAGNDVSAGDVEVAMPGVIF